MIEHQPGTAVGPVLAGNPVPPGSSTLELDLVPDGDQTVVTRTHRVLPEPTRDVHRSGWEHYLSRLVVVAVVIFVFVRPGVNAVVV